MTRPRVARAGENETRRGSAVVVGASLAGLMTGLALSRVGIGVTVLERATGFPRTGAAIRLDESRRRRLAQLGRSIPAAIPSCAPDLVPSTWTAVHDALCAAVAADPHIEVRHDTAVQHVDQDAESAWAVAADGSTFRGDVVVGADGYRSLVRRHVAPEKPDATFAGYLIWLGLADEAAIPSPRRWPLDVAFLSSADEYLFGYPVPGHDGSLLPGSRQLGWAWYDAGRNDLLRETGCVVGSHVHHSLTAAHIPAATFRALADEARDRWPAPWRDAILDCIRRRAIVGTPITEYVPDRLVDGRLALVGDAAHVPTPMTGMGFGASLDDAEAIAAAIAAGRNGSSVVEALRAYERKRLGTVRRMVQSGQEFSRGFASRTA